LGEPPSDRADVDVGPFYEDHFDDDVDYYDGDVEDDAKIVPIDMENGAESEENELENVLEAIGDEVEVEDEEASEWSCITNVNSRLGPHYDNHGKEIP